MTRALAVFDLDGTLCNTSEVDGECFFGAVSAHLGVAFAELEWSTAPHVTDSGIVDWLWRRHRGRRPSDPEVAGVERDFLSRLASAQERAASRFQCIAGAREALDGVRDAGWDVAIATGSWRASARLKLRACGLEPPHALATANDGLERERIVRSAIARCRGSGDAFARIVSIGDGPWDVRTSAELDLPFVGIASGKRAARLGECGATSVLPDLADLPAFLRALERATPPDAR